MDMDDIALPPTATQDAIPALADDLLKDRIRQFLEFLDDEVCPRPFPFHLHILIHAIPSTSHRGTITTTGTPSSGCSTGMRIG